MKLTTPVEFPKSGVTLSCGDRIMSLGSCFADGIGRKLLERGFDVCLNPFGTLYNPASIADSIARLDSGRHFTERDCVQMGSRSAKWCSFHHHTLAARDSREEFLASANEALDRASAFWKSCNKVLVTLGTSWCYRFTGVPDGTGREFRDGLSGDRETGMEADFIRKTGLDRETGMEADLIRETGLGTGRGAATEGIIVANCLKRDAKEFRREFIPASETGRLISGIVRNHPDKDFIFTVSPIRHFKDGAHGNQLSKANLLIGLNEALQTACGRLTPEQSGQLMPEQSGQLTPEQSGQLTPEQSGSAGELQVAGHPRCDYFPAYEIILDELRDYRFYAEDMVHPSEQTVSYIFERFIGWALPESEKEEFARREKAFRQSRHMDSSSRK